MGMGNSKKGLKSDINITPYIDILLVLLIIFMVVTPVRKTDLPVRAPRPPAPEPVAVPPRTDAIVVTIGEGAEIEINRTPVEISGLGAKLQEIFSARANKDLFISASRSLPYGDIVKVIDISKGAGVVNIGLLNTELRK